MLGSILLRVGAVSNLYYSRQRTIILSLIQILIRQEDVQVLHGFDSVEHAQAYLSSELFQNDVFVSLKPLWSAEPEVRIYSCLLYTSRCV